MSSLSKFCYIEGKKTRRQSQRNINDLYFCLYVYVIIARDVHTNLISSLVRSAHCSELYVISEWFKDKECPGMQSIILLTIFWGVWDSGRINSVFVSVVIVLAGLYIDRADPSGRAVLRRGSATARLLGLRVRIAPGAWMFLSCECCVLSSRGLCVLPSVVCLSVIVKPR